MLFRRASRLIAWVAVLGLFAGLGGTAGLPPAADPFAPGEASARGQGQPGVRVTPAATAVIDFADLARRSAGQPQPSVDYEIPHMPYVEPPASGAPAPATYQPAGRATGAVAAVSPPPVLSFLGLEDIPREGASARPFPPDTMGAVGPSQVLTTQNNNYRVHDKATGAILSTTNINVFWQSVLTGAVGVFDPRATYDPYNDRFVMAAAWNSRSPSSSILVAVSQGNTASGTWYLARFDADDTDTDWADFPTLGFNQNWIAVSVNMFPDAGGNTTGSRLWAFDDPTARTGSFNAQRFTGLSV